MNWTQPPLPFRGNKRWALKLIQNEFKTTFRDVDAVIDLFGGSGIVSRTAKDTLPRAEVYYNDYDNYSKRLANVEQTNILIENIKSIMQRYGVPKNKRASKACKAEILRLIDGWRKSGRYIDYITVSSNILFSGRYATSLQELARPDEIMYNTVRDAKYDSTGYLDGLKVIHEDVYDAYVKLRGGGQILWIIDPPYPSTNDKGYKGRNDSATITAAYVIMRQEKRCMLFTSEASKAPIINCDGIGCVNMNEYLRELKKATYISIASYLDRKTEYCVIKNEL